MVRQTLFRTVERGIITTPMGFYNGGQRLVSTPNTG